MMQFFTNLLSVLVKTAPYWGLFLGTFALCYVLNDTRYKYSNVGIVLHASSYQGAVFIRVCHDADRDRAFIIDCLLNLSD